MPRTATIAVVLGTAAAVLAARRADAWQRDHGALPAERIATLPGDELLPAAHEVTTRATGIAAPPGRVWPWVAQLGQDRGGFYSLTWIENALGAQIRNADRIHPEWQERAVGDRVRGDPQRVAWEVVHWDPPRALVLRGAGPSAPAREGVAAGPFDFVWAIVVEPDGAGGSRLVARERFAHDGTALGRAVVAALARGSGPMTRAMLRGIRRRAEGAGGD
ncbi:MAG: SRPBCC family protein [Miltoncostaeaceae bacterium]